MAPKIASAVIATASLSFRPSSAFFTPQTLADQQYRVSTAPALTAPLIDVSTERRRNKAPPALQVATAQAADTSTLGPRIPIHESFPGAKRIHSNPDIFVIESFLDDDSCQDIIDKAATADMAQSPVAYAGWTSDFKDLTELGDSFDLITGIHIILLLL